MVLRVAVSMLDLTCLRSHCAQTVDFSDLTDSDKAVFKRHDIINPHPLIGVAKTAAFGRRNIPTAPIAAAPADVEMGVTVDRSGVLSDRASGVCCLSMRWGLLGSTAGMLRRSRHVYHLCVRESMRAYLTTLSCCTVRAAFQRLPECSASLY